MARLVRCSSIFITDEYSYESAYQRKPPYKVRIRILVIPRDDAAYDESNKPAEYDAN